MHHTALHQEDAAADFPPNLLFQQLAGEYISGGVKVQTSKDKGFVDLEMHFSRDQLMGSAFVAFGIVLFLGFFYAAVLSKLLPPYENQLLSTIQNDRYYCLLVPLTLPVIIVAVYMHWLSMKMFKHA